ncbi:deoxyhypusine hydroxylase-like isoform X2 [Corticium candelabrum]|uniref:deoxyhypusine hydroxylase-like isoform X2 n=1 Tax=Corticium candelabrum TaxID=121492 RepID=UPI002E260B64|nr:deoxyhypusine hydroxylase-like isoform X2 [Corticium candelabrum]
MENDVAFLEALMLDQSKSLATRFRALFSLRNVGGQQAIQAISKCFSDPSELFKHECAYCLGQMQDTTAIPILISLLKDSNQETVVRHEAGEALAAIGDPSVESVLKDHAHDHAVEVAETCQIGLDKMKYMRSPCEEKLSENPYCSVDPAPPMANADTTVIDLEKQLLDPSLSLFQRYRVIFTLRNRGSKDCVLALSKGLQDNSALFRHEIAYVLGQIQHEVAVPALIHNLENLNEHPMVRHECAEALGSIANESCVLVLKRFADDSERIVKESCFVALDMYEHETSKDFQYCTVPS